MTAPVLGHRGHQYLSADVAVPIEHRGAVLLTSPSRQHQGQPRTVEAIEQQPRVPMAAKQCALASLLCGAWAAALWTSTHVHPDATLHTVALFVHLSALIVGLGAVLTIDWCALLWLRGDRRLVDVLRLASTNHPIIWFGLALLTASGALLSPDLTALPTQLKLGLVLVAGLNGVHACAVQRQLEEHADAPPPRLLVRSVLGAGLSQICWWGATVIGFLTHQAH